METNGVSQRVQNMYAVAGAVLDFLTDPVWEERRRAADMCDFLLGNPHEFPLEGMTAALQRWSVPRDKDWFAYKMSEPQSQQIIAESLRRSHGLPFAPDDVIMTSGAFAGLSTVIGTIVDPGDEIIYISPPWFFYGMMIASYGGRAVSVPCDPVSFDLDLEAIRRAITPRTRGIIVNSPNNPTGRIYPPETLAALGRILEEASRAHGHTIYLLSDEAYRKIVYDGATYPTPAAYYAETFVIYTYGKTTLSPGQRMGYIALAPTMSGKDAMSGALFTAMIASGFTFPNALLQHALADIEKLSIDIPHLQQKRDRLSAALLDMGYELRVPEGTFYLMVRSPIADDRAFTELLAQNRVLCLPGSVFEMPGYFRVSLTANDLMIERGIPAFAQALAQAKNVNSPQRVG